jgi:hypothetical protein
VLRRFVIVGGELQKVEGKHVILTAMCKAVGMCSYEYTI